MSAAEDGFALYADAEDSRLAEVENEARLTAERRVLAWRLARFFAIQQLRDLAAEHSELAAMLARSFEAERTALNAVLERTRRELRT